MIRGYHRPEMLDEALNLLSRPSPKTIPIGGGTMLSRNPPGEIEVVDLQKLGLNQVLQNNNVLEIGGTATLQSLLDHEAFPAELRMAIQTDWSANLRKRATLAGAIVTCDGRSTLVTGLVALNCLITWLPGEEEVPLGDYLALRRSWNKSRLIQKIKVPLQGTLRIERISRSPKDLPVVCVGLCRWSSGRTRVALGGFGPAPILAMDGPEAVGADLSAYDAYAGAGDEWASAEYRAAMAKELVHRLLDETKG